MRKRTEQYWQTPRIRILLSGHDLKAHVSEEKHEAQGTKVKWHTKPLAEFSNRKVTGVLGLVLHACSTSTQKAEAGGSHVQGQPGLHSETLSLKKKKNGGGRISHWKHFR
jgi:hypothetical protein